MARRKKHAQKHISSGCLICGAGVGRGIAHHVKSAHSVKYTTYLKCFFAAGGKDLLTQRLESGKWVFTFLARRFKKNA